MANIVGFSLRVGRRVPFSKKLIRMINRVVLSCDIPPETDIHPTVFFSHHGLGVVINSNAVIGEGTRILQNVTIGGSGKRRMYEGVEIKAPIIGKNVRIYSGAQVLGPVVIGDNVIIGAGSIVLDDIPEGSVVVGHKARIIK